VVVVVVVVGTASTGGTEILFDAGSSLVWCHSCFHAQVTQCSAFQGTAGLRNTLACSINTHVRC